MQLALAARGPDQSGRDSEPGSGLILAHTRLAILDLSDAGRQPMSSADGRYLIVYNGEIYNYTEIRDELARRHGCAFRTGTDTEVLLQAIQQWGYAQALTRCSGMFALAVWDRTRRELVLARDRLGKKPLYYRLDGDGLAFASELRALNAGAERMPEVDPEGLGGYLALGYVPGQASIYKDVHSLPPGSFLRLAGPGGGGNELIPAQAGLRTAAAPYFTPSDQAEAAYRAAGVTDGPALDRALQAAVRRAVEQRCRADVPVGLFLSGGVDSTLVAAVAASRGHRPKAFTMGFDDPAYDESAKAAAVAKHLGLEHHVATVTGTDAREMAQECVAGSHEPFADQSLIPTQMLSGLVGREVKVALGGDGGHELFCGYKKYTMFERLERIGGRVPAALRRPLGALACPTSEAVLRLWPKTPRGQRAYKALRSLGGPQALSAMALTRSPLINRFVDPGARARIAAAQAALPAAGILAGVNRLQGLAPTRDRLQLLDQCTYLPDNILRKADRASMAKSLEVRSPLLDDEVARLAWRLKTYTNVDPKDPLLRMMHGLLPQRLCQKEKKGFSPPMARWLTGELRDWGEAQLRRTAELTGGLVDGAAVRWEWARCQKRGMNKMQAQEFWTLIMLNCLRPA